MENIKIPPLAVSAAQQTGSSPDDSTEMHTASPSSKTASATPSPQRSPLHGRHYPSLNNNLYIPHQASVPDPSLFSPSSQPEEKTSDVEKRGRRHNRHHRSRHERDEKHSRNQSFPIEHVTEMPFQLGKKKARAAAAEAEGRAKAREKVLEEEARRVKEAKEAKEELAGRFPFARTEEVLTQAGLEKLREKRLKEEQANSDALGDITEQSASFSQRLDKTCYSLLENAASIRTSIQSVQALTQRTVERHREFDARSSGMLRDARAQILKFNNFDRQLKSIDALESRLEATRQQAAVLDKRLEAVRKRILDWDHEEDVWQAKITRRSRMLGAALLAMFVVWVGMKVMGWWHPGALFGSFRSKTTVAPESVEAVVCLHGVSPDWSCLMPSDGGEDVAASTASTAAGIGQTTSMFTAPIEPIALEEPLQRIIDEL
ncbi:hypothetical protein MferCBS31731_001923 [Microsporum ferrugineum]